MAMTTSAPPSTTDLLVAICAHVDTTTETVGFHPDTPIEVGTERFVTWHRKHFNVPKDSEG